MAKGEKPSERAAGRDASRLFQTTFEVNVDFSSPLRAAKELDQRLDTITRKIEKLNQMAPLSAKALQGTPTFASLNPRAAPTPNLGEALVGPRTINPSPLVFSNNAISGGQSNNRRDPVPLVTDAITRDADGTPRPVVREQRRGRSSSAQSVSLEPTERFESVYEQGAARQRLTAPYFQPESPQAPLSRRQQVLQQRQFGRLDPYEGLKTTRNTARAYPDRESFFDPATGYTIVPPNGQVRGALTGDVLSEAAYPMRGPFDYQKQRYPSDRLTARQRVLQQPNLRERVFTLQGAADRTYTELPTTEGIRAALPSMEDVEGRAPRAAESYERNSSYVVGDSSPWQPTRRARVANTLQPGYNTVRQGLDDLGGGARRVGDAFNTDRLLSAASSLFIAQQVGQTLGQLGQGTIGQSVKIDEARALLANSLVGGDIGRRGADRLADRLIDSEYIQGAGSITTSELGLSRADLAERYKSLAPIVRVGSQGPEDFAQRLQRGSVLSSLLMARDPSQGQGGVNVALSELLAGGSTRFLSLSRRFELSNSQLRGIETSMGGEGVADPVAVAIKALEKMGIGPSYLATRAQTFAGELDQSRALFSNLRADTFERGTGVLGRNLATVNDAFSTYKNTEAYGQQLERGGGAVARGFDFLTKPFVQSIAGNMLRTGGGLDEGYLARSASEIMTPGERGGRRGYVSETGEIVAASEAFREAAQTIQDAHLERLLQAPQYSPGQQTSMDTLLTTGVTIGGAMLANRLFGGAGGLLLRGAMTAGAGGAATLAAAGAAAAPAAIVGGTALAAGATVASYRRQATTAQAYERLEKESPDLLEGVSAFGRDTLEETTRPWERFLPQNLFMPLYETGFNAVSRGGYGERTYGEKGATRDTFIARAGQRSTVENAIEGMAATSWQPGMSRAELTGPLKERVFDLQREAAKQPDSPVGQWFQREDALDLAMAAVDRSWRTAPEKSNRALLTGAVERAYAYDQPISLVDPETGRREALKAGFSLEEGRAFAERLAANDPDKPGGVNQAVLAQRIERATQRLDLSIDRNERAQTEGASIYRQLNTAMLPGVFDQYDPNPDRREVIPSRVPLSALSTPDGAPTKAPGARFNVVASPAATPRESPRAATRPTGNKPERPGARIKTPERVPVVKGRREFTRTSEDATARLLGGVATADHAEHLARGSRGGGGFDVLSANGQFRAPMGGALTYLRTPEDYRDPLYQDMFPGGRKTYGVSAVVVDRFGKTLSVSHLADSDTYQDGRVKKGDYLGAQGNTGLSRSGKFPGRNIRDGYLEDTGEFAYGAGSHGHVQFGQLGSKGRWEELDAQLGPSYWQAPDEDKARTGAAVSFAPVVNLTLNQGDSKAAQKQQIDDGMEQLKRQLYTLVFDGYMDDLTDLTDDLKKAQGKPKDPRRPKARGK